MITFNLIRSERDKSSSFGDRALLDVILVGEGHPGQDRDPESGPKSATFLEGRTKPNSVVFGKGPPPEPNPLSRDHRDDAGDGFDESLKQI